jgi:hypothetical protein
MCWHTYAGAIDYGYRCGDPNLLNGTEQRLVYEAD